MSKKKVVLDTNIYVSATFWEGNSYKIVQKALNNEIEAFVSEEIVEELKKVLKRDFGRSEAETDEIVESIKIFTRKTDIKEYVDIIKDDPDDNKILDCAIASCAEYIVSQDKHLLMLKEFRGIYIVNPKNFLVISKD